MTRTLSALAATLGISLTLAGARAETHIPDPLLSHRHRPNSSAAQGMETFSEGRKILAAATPGDTIHLVTFNIHAGMDQQGIGNLDRVGELLIRLEADVALLQEVDRGTERSGGVDQLSELARQTGFYSAWGPSLEFQGGEYGIAVLSRWPVIEQRVVPLPVSPPQERAGGSFRPRSALLVSIGAPDGTIVVLNTHLDPTPDDHHRRQEMDRLLEVADSLRTAGEQVVVGGDLNALPESAVIATATTRGWIDSWRDCGEGEGMTYPADTPLRRIDYLFLEPGATCTRARVLRSEVSDHRPFSVVLSITGSSQVGPGSDRPTSTEKRP